MTWTIELTPGIGLLHADGQLPNSVTTDLADAIGGAATASASHQGIPSLECAHVIAEYRPPPLRSGQRKRPTPALFADASNLLPSARAAIAGLMNAGTLPADPACLIGPVMRLGDVLAGSQLVLHITELEARGTA